MKTKEPKECIECQKEYTPHNITQKYCSTSCYRGNLAKLKKTEEYKIKAEIYRQKTKEKAKIQYKKYYDSVKDTSDFKEKSKASSLKRIYGISLDQYNELLVNQDFSCYVCGRHENSFKTKLAVDHNHKTGEIRGLLCTHCNHRVIGRLTDPKLFRRAAQYLEECHTGWFVPTKKRKKKRT